MEKNVSANIDGKEIVIETGKIAKQAGGSVVVRSGDTMVLVTACSSDPREGIDFFPLTCEYRERLYAGGRIPGGFFKREGRLTEKETLSSRLIDRPIRPMFPDGYKNEVQIIASVISADPKIEPDVLAMTGASAALMLSPIPFLEPVAGIRVGRVNGEYVAFPTVEQVSEGDMDMVVAGSESSILMVEGGGYEISEEDMLGGIKFAHEKIKQLIEIQKELIGSVEVKKNEFSAGEKENEEIIEKINSVSGGDIRKAFDINDKKERSGVLAEIYKATEEKLTAGIESEEEKAILCAEIKGCFKKAESAQMRKMILEESVRIGGRKQDEIRPITCEVGLLPRSHGSALFTRGETQSLVTSTLGTKLDEQKIENIQGDSYKSYMLHYNFPPYCTGEVKPIRGTSRREIGHGHLAERSLAPVLPVEDAFPYTIRVVSDIMESNGSSSMASICGGSLSLMDAGVPIKTGVAGIAMGLIKDGDNIAILSDILGDEDHLGDMDFKVAGTKDGITAFQMDIKIDGITFEIMEKALRQAKDGRLHILGKMNEAITEPRKDISQYAPRMITVKIPVDKIGALIGPGGKTIRGIQDKTGATITVDDDGTVLIASVEGAGGESAREFVESLAAEPEIGKTYTGTVKGIQSFGAFVEFMPGREGLLHISEIDRKRIEKVEDVLNMGDEVTVKLLNVDNQGKCKLSRKAVLAESDG